MDFCCKLHFWSGMSRERGVGEVRERERERGERVRVRKGEIAEKNFYVTRKQWRKKSTISVFFYWMPSFLILRWKRNLICLCLSFTSKFLKDCGNILNLWHVPWEKINFAIWLSEIQNLIFLLAATNFQVNCNFKMVQWPCYVGNTSSHSNTKVKQ